MSGVTRVEPDTGDLVEAVGWEIREATLADVPGVVAGISGLLVELGGQPAAMVEMEGAARALIDDPDAGVLLVVVQEQGWIVGVLGVSWQVAIRVPGCYGLIQELWVHPDWRGRGVGRGLLAALAVLARDQGIVRLEVGLPSERYPHLEATQAFYTNNNFTTTGLRMQRPLR